MHSVITVLSVIINNKTHKKPNTFNKFYWQFQTAMDFSELGKQPQLCIKPKVEYHNYYFWKLKDKLEITEKNVKELKLAK